MKTDMDVSEILNSARLEQDIQALAHSPAYYRVRRWVEAERANPLRASRVAKGIGWMLAQKLSAGIGDEQG